MSRGKQLPLALAAILMPTIFALQGCDGDTVAGDAGPTRVSAAQQTADNPPTEEPSSTGSTLTLPTEGQGPPPIPEGVAFRDTPSGLKYAVLSKGGGASPQPGQEIEIHYTAWLADTGYRFDSTVDKGRPLRVTMGKDQLPTGLEAAISSMKVAEKRRLLIPPELTSYPDGTPASTDLPKGATLLYDVELLAIDAGNVSPVQ